MQDSPLLVPTHAIGSHGFPGWFWSALDEIREGRFGTTDEREALDDATRLAIQDQERAGMDIITDGEMRRTLFVQNFYGRMDGLEATRPLRTMGPDGYDSVPRFRPVDRVTVSAGLGIVEEFEFLRTQSDRPLKSTCPGPLTLSIHIQVRRGDAYDGDRLALCWDLVPVVNEELKALVTAGARYIQLDEPSAAIMPGRIEEYIELLNASLEGVEAKIGLHVCFGNLMSRPRGRRSYAWLFPALQAIRCHQFAFEYANREMAEIELWDKVGVDREVACGVVDVKSFYLETPEDIAERILLCARHVPLEQLSVTPDCGFSGVPRWLAREKLNRLVAGTRLARERLGLDSTPPETVAATPLT
jgi:5-methyltetrahydropteroyltriglutamate--homocysteine methyltransferase